jgi:hypothetical protein
MRDTWAPPDEVYREPLARLAGQAAAPRWITGPGHPDYETFRDSPLRRAPGQEMRAPAWMATASWAAMSVRNQPPLSTVMTGPVQPLPLFSPWITSQ